MEIMRITSVRNAQGCKVKRCCASCQHKCIDINGNRICAETMENVDPRYRCKNWQMSDGLKKAGISGGVVRRLEYQEVVIE